MKGKKITIELWGGKRSLPYFGLALSALECQYALEVDDSLRKFMKKVLSELKEYKVK